MADVAPANFCNVMSANKTDARQKDTFALQLVLLKAGAVSNAENTACGLHRNESLNHGFQWASFVNVTSTECLSHIQIGPGSADIDKGSV